MRLLCPALVVSIGLSLACGGVLGEPAADVGSPQTFAGDGLSFRYPGNWTATRESESMEVGDLVTVTLESPGNALAIVQIFPSAVEVDLDVMAPLLASSMQEAVGEVSGGMMGIEPPSFADHPASFGGVERAGRRATFTIDLLGVSVPHTMDIHLVPRESGDVVIVTQVPDEDRGAAGPGFDLLRDSFALDGP